ncbi:putative zinc transporter msc2 [Botryosphaeria dothidea]
MKGRPNRSRGESDLGRPASAGSVETTSGYGFPPVGKHADDPAPANSLHDAITGALVPLPYVLASLAFATNPQPASPDAASDSAFDRLRAVVSEDAPSADVLGDPQRSAFLEACILASGTLLLTAFLAKLRLDDRMLDRRKAKFGDKAESMAALGQVKQIVTGALSTGLPFYAATQLGGVRVGLVLLSAVACGLCGTNATSRPFLVVRRLVQERKLLCAYLGLGVIYDVLSLSTSLSLWQLLTGYVALVTAVFVLPPPMPITIHTAPPPAQTNGITVQFFYGFVTGSLGLLTDSIHMFFDCAGLAVGLIAAVMSKWPPNARFPYGYGKIDTLSGFANGIFLILVSFEIILDAVERIWEGHELRRLDELLVVSILGLIVNIVGLTAMGHAHAHAHGGHDHHHHGDENMQGIFLHIMADALGSVAVIISTLLTKWNGWSGWDPLASSIIALLIFFSALPLTLGSGMRLLLCNNQQVEDALKDALRDLNSIRGVVSYSSPRFWIEDMGAAHAHAHADSHDSMTTAMTTAMTMVMTMTTPTTTHTRTTMDIHTLSAMATATTTTMIIWNRRSWESFM